MDASDYYEFLIENCVDELPRFTREGVKGVHFDRKIKTRDTLIQECRELPYLMRFTKQQFGRFLDESTLIEYVENETICFDKDTTYMLINGKIKLRDHANKIGSPLLCWNMFPGDYITHQIHQELLENPEIWVKAETES